MFWGGDQGKKGGEEIVEFEFELVLPLPSSPPRPELDSERTTAIREQARLSASDYESVGLVAKSSRGDRQKDQEGNSLSLSLQSLPPPSPGRSSCLLNSCSTLS